MEIQRAIRETCALFDDKGRDFEALTEGLLRELGFAQVQQQNAGSQYGRDFSAFRYRESGRERWFFECKNYQAQIGVAEIAPKLVHHLDRRGLDAFAILGPSRLSNELRELLERNPFSFPVFDWTGDAFVKVVLIAEAARRRWFPQVSASVPPATIDGYRRMLFDSALLPAGAPLELNITPRHVPPYQMAYFLRGEELHEYTTDFEFEHQVVLHNRGRLPLLVTELFIATEVYEPLPDRLLVQMKAKGEFNPLFMSYSPKPMVGHRCELLRSRMRQLQPGESELHFMKLDDCSPGIYTLRITASFVYEGKTASLDACNLRVCACAGIARSDSPDRLLLYTWRGHYPGAAGAALRRSRQDWERVARAAGDDCLLYLGPIPMEESGRGPDRQMRALVRSIPAEGDGASRNLRPELAIQVADWGDAVGDLAPHDPLMTMRSIAEFNGMTLTELARRFGPGKADE